MRVALGHFNGAGASLVGLETENAVKQHTFLIKRRSLHPPSNRLTPQPVGVREGVWGHFGTTLGI